MATTTEDDHTDGATESRTAPFEGKRPDDVSASEVESPQLVASIVNEETGDNDLYGALGEDMLINEGRRPSNTSDIGEKTTTAAPVVKDITDSKIETADEASFKAEGYRPVEDVKQELRNIMDPVEQKIAPTNWNAISNIKIRTSLGGGQNKIKAEEVEDSEKQEEPLKGEEPGKERESQEHDESQKKYETQREKATRIALERVDGFRQRLSGMNPHDGPVSAYKTAQQELYAAEVDYNYCLFYPYGAFFLGPPTASARTHGRMQTAAQEKRLRMWQLTEICMKNGRLQDLRDGRIVVFSPEELNEERRKHRPGLSGLDHIDLQERKAAGLSTSDSEDTKGWVQGNKTIAKSRQTVIEMFENLDADSTANSRRDTVELSLEPSATGYQPCDDSKSDGEMILNLHDRAAESKASGSEICNNPESERSDSDLESESQSEDGEGDDMTGYSKRDEVAIERAKHHSLPSNSNRNTSILAELSSQDLNAQLRYFHVTKSPQEVDPDTPVRCLVCAQHGHMAEVCEFLTCTACGAFNQHITQSCPNSSKCSKCRELGHDKQHCPYKLKNIAQSEIVCGLCQQNSHAEEDCELFWRTSGKPWGSNLSGNNVRLSCYECGHSGHLGNDCPTRRPGKSMGTSTWGTGKSRMPIKSEGDMGIKGRAQNPINLDDSEDELAFFYRSKVPGPARKGQIRINTAPKKPVVKQPLHSDSSHQDHDRENRRPHTQIVQEDNYYRPSDRRSVSPGYRDHPRNYRADRYQHEASRGQRRPARGGELYRPMPSSGNKAWSQHRS